MEEKQKLNDGTTDVVKTSIELKQDASSKQVMKDRWFLANILKAVVPEYKDVSEEDIAFKYIEPGTITDQAAVSRNLTNHSQIAGSAEEDSTVNEGIVRYDVMLQAVAPAAAPVQKYKHGKNGGIIQINLKIDMEAQVKYDPGYPICKRAMFYCARMLSAEFDGKAETMDYKDLYKVYSIWICFEPPQYAANTISRFKTVKEDVLGEIDVPEADYNLMESVLIRLGNEDEAPRIRMFELLYALFGMKPGEERVKQLQELGYAGTSLEKEAETMISFSERTKEFGYEKGQQYGYEKGQQYGYEKGQQYGYEKGQEDLMHEMVSKLNENGFAIEKIAELTGLSKEQVKLALKGR